MMTHYFQWLLIALCTCFLHTGNAQQSSFVMRIGPGHIARQDLTFSPFVHRNLSLLNGGMRYERQARTVQWFDLGFSSFSPSIVDTYPYTDEGETEETYPHHVLLVNLTYAYGEFMGPAQDSARFVMGAFVKADVQPSSYNFGRFSSFGYFASMGLGIWGRQTIDLGPKSNLLITAQLPVVALVARSPYLINDDEFIENTYSHNGLTTFFEYLGDGQLQTLNRVQQFALDIDYTHDLGYKWTIGAGYGFQFLHHNRPTTLWQFVNVFQLKLGINL